MAGNGRLIEVTPDEAATLRSALRAIIALNESTLEGLRRMSHRQASLHEEEATRAATRIVAAREFLAKLEPL